MLLQGKKALIMGLANNRSIAYGIASCLKAQGARLAFNYVGEAIKKRVEPLSEELGGEFTFQCDVCDDAQIQAAADLVKEKWGDLDILVHSVAFANRQDLVGRFVDTSRDGFKLALEVSAYSLTGLCRAFAPAPRRQLSDHHDLPRLHQDHPRLQRHGRGQGRLGSLGALPGL